MAIAATVPSALAISRYVLADGMPQEQSVGAVSGWADAMEDETGQMWSEAMSTNPGYYTWWGTYTGSSGSGLSYKNVTSLPGNEVGSCGITVSVSANNHGNYLVENYLVVC